jgi:hypothetical protein
VSAREGVVFIVLLVVLLLAPVLARAQAAADSVVLTWTAPLDPGVGAAARYDIRMSNSLITADNFASLTAVPAPAPAAPGAAERVVVRGLQSGRSYWFAVRSADAAGNVSDLSNIVRWDGSLDTSPPATPTGLTAVPTANGAIVALRWRQGSEPDLAGYRVWRAPNGGGTWTLVARPAAKDSTWTDFSPPSGVTKVGYAVSAVDGSGNESARSAVAIAVLSGAQAALATEWTLDPPFPNPARMGEAMHLPVEVPVGGAEARIEIVDAGGRVVRRFDVRPGGFASVRVDWDGTNDAGLACAPGVYRACLVAGSTRQTVRVARVP